MALPATTLSVAFALATQFAPPGATAAAQMTIAARPQAATAAPHIATAARSQRAIAARSQSATAIPPRTDTAIPPRTATAARSVSVDDTGHLHLLKAFGSVLLEEGYAGGTLPGQAKVRLVVGSTVTSTFSIQTRYGTIYGSGRAALHSSGRYASFGGTLSVSKGTASYAHAHGAGKLYGVIDRRTSALTVQTVGTLSY
jgi:hypothetical protein